VNVGILDVDSLIANLALMKYSAHHKARGDSVSFYGPLDVTPDVLIASKLFDFTPDFAYFPDCEILRGGTGYDPAVRLPEWGDTIYPDYGLYGCTEAMGRFTRGCPRGCPFCLVGKMDGTRVHQVAELTDFWRGQRVVRLLDDNLTAMPDLFVSVCEQLAELRVCVKFEALDARFMTAYMARSLAKVRREGRVHFAFDHVRDEEGVRRGIAALKSGGFPLSQATFYVLIGYDSTPEQDLYRVMLLDALGVESFAMPFNKSDRYQRRFSRWVNAKPAFRSCTFAEYDSSTRGATMKGQESMFTVKEAS